MWPNLQETADLIFFAEEILNGKLYFLCSDTITNANSFTAMHVTPAFFCKVIQQSDRIYFIFALNNLFLRVELHLDNRISDIIHVILLSEKVAVIMTKNREKTNQSSHGILKYLLIWKNCNDSRNLD